MREQLKKVGALTLDASTDKDLSRKSVLACHLGYRAGTKPDIDEYLEPHSARKESEVVGIVHHLHAAIARPEHEGELGAGTGVAWIRVARPLEIAGAPAVRSIVAAMVRARLEAFGNVVGHEDRDTAHPAVLVRGGDRLPQIGLGSHVVDSVMNKDGIEASPETQRAHISADVFALGIQLSRDGQHVIGEIDQRHLEFTFEMERVVATSTPKLEDRTSRRFGRAQQRCNERCFLGVLLRPGEQRPPRGKITVQMVSRRQVAIMVVGC
jgi:hypothetical protein